MSTVLQLILSVLAGGISGSFAALVVVRRTSSQGHSSQVGKSSGRGNVFGNNATGDSNLTGARLRNSRNVVASGPGSTAAGNDITYNPDK